MENKTEITFDENGLANETGCINTFHTDKDDIYIGEQFTQVIQGLGLPSGVYLDKPELTAGKNEAIIRQNDKWVLVPDFRGQTVYKKATGESVKIEKVGALPDDLTEKEYPDPYATWSDDFNNWWISPADGMRKQRDQAEVEKNRLITLAEQRVNDLTEATDESVFEPDEIDPADIELLKQWKRYRVFIKRVDPAALIINWPELPEPEEKELNDA